MSPGANPGAVIGTLSVNASRLGNIKDATLINTKPQMTFKGFGTTPNGVSIDTFCKAMLKSYEHTKQWLSSAPDNGIGTRLLAQAVVRWAGGKEDKHIQYGRIFVANGIQNIIGTLDKEYPETHDYAKVMTALTMLVKEEKESLLAL